MFIEFNERTFDGKDERNDTFTGGGETNEKQYPISRKLQQAEQRITNKRINQMNKREEEKKP